MADWPPSFSHIPGIIAPKYGPHTPGIGRAADEAAMWQVEVPAMTAMRRSSSFSSTPPSSPSPPACASIRPMPTTQRVVRPSSAAAVDVKVPGGRANLRGLLRQTRAPG